jgi:putative ABC transport system permease protein
VIRHILKMVWNRKGANSLIALEILIAFLVLFAVSAMAAYQFDHYRQTLGFDWRNVWKVTVTFGEEDIPALMDAFTLEGGQEDVTIGSIGDVFERMLRELERFEEVESAAAASFAPYASSAWRWGLDTDRGKVVMYLLNATRNFDQVMNLELVQGRWFEPADSAATHRTIVVNQRLARDIFGDDDAVGQVVVDQNEDGDVEMKIVGVVSDFRYKGELSSPVPFAFMWPRDEANKIDFLEALVLRVRPGTPASFEEEILSLLRPIAPTWSFKIEPLAAARESYLRKRLAPLVVAGLLAGFLMIMVALGLVGVLWQNVTQRTRELGLRRAKGATAVRIRRQVLGELFIMTSLAMAVGYFVVVQLPITGWFPMATGRIYWQGLLIATASMAVLTAAAGLYPSFLATRIQPAEALHYE